MIGKTISHHNILDKLGGGGMCSVYKAEDIKLDLIAALKSMGKNILCDGEVTLN